MGSTDGVFLYVGEYLPEEKHGPAADCGTPGTPATTPGTPGTLMPTPRPTIDFCTACCICSSACSSPIVQRHAAFLHTRVKYY